jgi:Sulfatase
MRRRFKLALMLFGAVLIGLAGAWQPLKTGVYFFSQSLAQVGKDVARQREIQRELAAGLKSNGAPVVPADFQGTVIYVIGASTTRRHLSLYGYHRATTPNLNRLQDSLLVQRDTLSLHSPATLSLAEILSAVGRDGSQDRYRLNLFTELRRARFKTWWLSNESEFTIWGNPTSLIGKQAEVQSFNKKSFRISPWGDFYDHQILLDLDTALRDPASRKFIFLHLDTVHSGYCDGIPPQFRDVLKAEDGLGKKFFGDAPDLSANVNCYDNAIRYVDHILGQIISKAKSQTVPTVMVYLSDHGANPAHRTGRNPSAPSAYHIEVPHLWYFNDDAYQVLSAKIEALKANLDKPYKSSDMFHTMLDLVGADPLQYDASRSIVSTNFLLHPRKTVPRSDLADIAYDDRLAQNNRDYLEIAREELAHIKASRPSDYRKLWAHRVDSIGKLMEAKSFFAGVEVDVVFDNKTGDFFVYHPPKESHGLKLREFLLATKDRPDLWFWFDWKNANEEDFAAASVRLAELDDEFSIKRRSLIETGADAIFPSLRKLSRSGFRHSYYVPTAEAVGCAQQPNEKKCAELAKEVASRARHIGAVTISFDRKASGFIRANISSFLDLQMASWQLDLSASDQGFSSKIGLLDGIDTLLVRFPSVFSY